eukprot:m.96913 g.96913  ORF g.96913 m.96913 type:complete len:358 (-) comp10190_c0_seq2:70-1143(-)
MRGSIGICCSRRASNKVVPAAQWPHLQYIGMGKNHSKPLNHPESVPFKKMLGDMPRSNSTVKAHYKLQHTTLGEGGFAKVKLARTKSVRKRDVAVKIASLKDKDAQREAELLAFLGDHPNVCHLLDFYVKGTHLHLVFPLCSEGDLMDLLLKEDRFSESLAALCTQSIVKAVAFCHSKNIAHRDIKGQNILVHKPQGLNEYQFKLTDFGAATYFAKWNQLHSQRIGSSCYVAPEVLKEKYYPPKADVWSIGATIYTVLHGEPPFFSQASSEVTFSRVLTETFELPTSIRKANSTCCQNFLLTCMTRYAWKRPNLTELAKHPWVQDEFIDFETWPDMDVRESEDPQSMRDEEILSIPT